MTHRLPPIALVTVAALALSGCATWEKPGASETDRDRDLAACEVLGYDRYPPALERYLATPAHFDRPETTCAYDAKGHVTACTTSPGHWIPDQWTTHDTNAAPRRAVIEDCMFGKGWHREVK
ncbi:hypothetical protein L2U69_09000 [Zavarzinia compransoris]|uniref:hypothetical protein n=1 Tax=Zavarzinia marina TaxID=2911065 RepID=UPI001F3C7DC5|nr:hypothetical protein [Zavarzinia marina]MCF4165778.1 hypothetical protein [Zavarzinia marina]